MPERLRYFTGLFLEEPEFTLEQRYHLDMRRSLNFALFDSGVLFGMEVFREAPDRVRVDPGMAVDRANASSQGREIVLSSARQVTLSGTSGQQFLIFVRYREQNTTPKPPLLIESRVLEDADVQFVLDGGPPLDANLNIVLARVQLGNLNPPDQTVRRNAVLRMGAGSGAPGSGAPTITSLTFSQPPRQGTSPVMNINGTNLADNPVVSVLTSGAAPDPQITAVLNAGASTNILLVVNLTIAAGAATGDRLVRVQTNTPPAVTTVPTGATAFNVLALLPAPAAINPADGRQTATRAVTITGTNFTSATAVAVLLNNGTLDANVTVTGITVVNSTTITATFTIAAGAAAGGRIVRVTGPGGDGLSAQNFFTILPAPNVVGISPSSQSAGNVTTVRGTNIRNPGIAPGNPATGTTVMFVDPLNPANNVAATAVTAVVDAGGLQRVDVTIPVSPAPTPFTTTLVLTFDGASGSPTPFIFIP
jgi:hypothetical protein